MDAAQTLKPPAGMAHGARRSGSTRGRFFGLCLFMIPFFAVGLFFLYTGFQNYRTGNQQAGLAVAGFASVFILMAGAFLALGYHGYRREEKLKQIRARKPDQPWLWRADWASGTIRCGSGRKARTAWVMALFWNAVSSPLLFVFPEEWAKGNKLIAVGLLFPLVGLMMIGWAIRTTVHWRKFGQSTFRLLTIPGNLGGALSGAVEVPAKLTPQHGFKMRLCCLRRTVTGSGKHRSVREQLLWEEENILQKDLLSDDRRRTGIPVYFRIPGDLPPSEEGNPAIIWRLETRAEVPGIDYSAEFNVPVFNTRANETSPTLAVDPTLAYQPNSEGYAPPVQTRIRTRERADGIEIYFPAARNPAAIVSLTVFVSLWSLFLWLLVAKQAPIIFQIVFGLFELLLLFILLSSLIYSVRVVADRTGLHIFHRMLLPTCTRRLPVDQIETIAAKLGGKTGNKTYYQLEAKIRSGYRYSAGSGIPDKRHAEWLTANLLAQLQINPNPTSRIGETSDQ